MNGKQLLWVLPVFLLTAASQAGENQQFMLKDGDTLVFLGNSITQGGSHPEGYISLIELFMGVNGYSVKIINAGISGHKSNDMLARLEKDVLSHEPDWVSVSCGVNDVWHQFSSQRQGVPLEEYRKNMTEIVDRIQKSGAQVLLLTATPIYEDLNSRENQMLKDYNELLRQLAKDKNLVLCDLFSHFAELYKQKLNDENLLTTDGVHMKPRGNRLMAREILKSLEATPQQLRRTEDRWELIGNLGN